MTRALLSLLLALCWAAPLRAEPGFLLGVGTHAGIGRDTTAHIQPLLASIGADAIRDDLLWSRVQAPGEAPAIAGAARELDALLSALAGAGTQVVLVLAYGNRDAGVVGMPDTEPEREAFARFAEWAVARFGSRVRYFEIWNEWNAGLGSGTRPPTPGRAEDYVALMRTVYPRLKRAAPEAVILGAGINGTDSDWLARFLAARGPDFLDGISVHPYVHFKSRAGVPERAVEWLDRARAAVSQRAEWRDKPFYVTEIGWPNSRRPEGIAPERTADFLTRFVLLARARSPWIRGVWWYELVDGGSLPRNNEHNFGLFRRAGEPKPAVAALGRVRALFERFDDWRETDVGADARLVIGQSSRGAAAGACAVFWSVFDRPAVVTLASEASTLDRVAGSGRYRRSGADRVRVEAESQPQTWCADRGRIEVASGPEFSTSIASRPSGSPP